MWDRPRGRAVPAPPAVRRGRRALPALLLGVVLTACGGSPIPAPPPPAAPTTTPLASVATPGTTVVRDQFCQRLTQAELTAALDAAPTDSRTWRNGDRAAVGGITDVVQEYGCRFTAGRRIAKTWVFAPPVTKARAASLAAKAKRGCARLSGAPAFGDPGVATRCGDLIAFSGLFGDAWLTCSLQTPGTLAERTRAAEDWCVSVLTAAAP